MHYFCNVYDKQLFYLSGTLKDHLNWYYALKLKCISQITCQKLKKSQALKKLKMSQEKELFFSFYFIKQLNGNALDILLHRAKKQYRKEAIQFCLFLFTVIFMPDSIACGMFYNFLHEQTETYNFFLTFKNISIKIKYIFCTQNIFFFLYIPT